MAKAPPPRKIDEKVLARMQKDLDGFIVKHQEILDKRAVKYANEIQPFWDDVAIRIENEIRAIYSQVQDANGVPIMKQPVEKAKFRNMQRQMERLQKLQDFLVERMGAPEQDEKMKRNLAYSFAEGYYYHGYAIEQSAKVAMTLPVLTQGVVMGVLANPWLPDGATYSDRLRANTVYLAGKMRDAVQEGVGKGWGINRLARRIKDIAGEGFYNSVRLARTEMTRAAAQGANHTYMQNADIMDGKRWNAVLDARTAPKDAQNDGKVFALDYDTPEKKGEPGRRIPNHPNCRCKWSPVLSALGISTRERIARGEGDTKSKFGERTYTPARDYETYAKERGLPDLNDAVRNEDPRRYLRRGETLADVPKNFFDPFTVASGAVVGTAVTIQEAAQIAIIDNAFTPVKTVKEANAWAEQNLTVKQVDYKGFDVELANEVNKQLYALQQLYPEVQDVNFVGTAQRRNTLLYEKQVRDFEERNQELLADMPLQLKESLIKRYVKKKKVSGITYAQATNKTWGELAGISFNEKWAKDYNGFKESLKSDVASGFHPVGTDNPASVLIHEFGHSIDYFLDKIGLRDKYLGPVVEEALADEKLAEELSRYATKNDREVVAEAFAEYRLNPNPRKWARKVGEAIENALEEYREGR